MADERCGGCARREEEAAAMRGESRAARQWRGLQNRRANEMKHTGKREKGNTQFPNPPIFIG
jgi:hypothetical protein